MTSTPKTSRLPRTTLRKKIPLVLKVFGILLIVVGSLTVATIATFRLRNL